MHKFQPEIPFLKTYTAPELVPPTALEEAATNAKFSDRRTLDPNASPAETEAAESFETSNCEPFGVKNKAVLVPEAPRRIFVPKIEIEVPKSERFQPASEASWAVSVNVETVSHDDPADSKRRTVAETYADPLLTYETVAICVPSTAIERMVSPANVQLDSETTVFFPDTFPRPTPEASRTLMSPKEEEVLVSTAQLSVTVSV